MKRRNILVSVVGGSFFAASSWAQERKAMKSASQSEYVFFLNDAERRSASSAALQYASELDFYPISSRTVSALYFKSSPSTRRRITESSFNSRVIGYRSNVGSLKERALQGVEGGFKFLPGYPDGQYCIVTFDSVFSISPDIYTEQISLGRDAASGWAWQFVDYYFAKRPFHSY